MANLGPTSEVLPFTNARSLRLPDGTAESMIPLVSVIIPTMNRPQFLARAVASAVAAGPESEVEVIVVPNGRDESWRESLHAYRGHKSVRVTAISEANANHARNHGLAASRGKLVRFLDDDDYLIAEGALEQYRLIEAEDAEVVSGSVALVDARDRQFDLWRMPETFDFCVAMLAPGRRCQPTAHVFRRDALNGMRWNPAIEVRQDLDWMFTLCGAKEWRWQKTAKVVGVWQHHWGARISTVKRFNDIRKLTVPMLMRTYAELEARDRLSPERKAAVVAAFWDCVHTSFFLEPSYWKEVVALARSIDPASRPQKPVFGWPLLNRLNPVVIEYGLLPKRWLVWRLRRFLATYRIAHHW